MSSESEIKTEAGRKDLASGVDNTLTSRDEPDQCRCRCDWCYDRRYYLAYHLAPSAPLPIKPRDPEEEARWHGGKECRNRYPCACHCPFCHFREAHYVHFHLGNWTDEETQRFLEGQRSGRGESMGKIRKDLNERGL